MLGVGGFSSVYSAVDSTTGLTVALKALRGDADRFNSGLQELKLLELVASSEFIITKLDALHYREHLFIVSEILGQSVAQHCLQLGAAERLLAYDVGVVKRLCGDLLSAIAFMAGLGLIHCDVKPANVCRSGPGFRLIDLGSAITTKDVLNSYTQSRFYRSPEVILGVPYGPKVDVWGAGASIVEVLVGTPLFGGSTTEKVLAAQVRACGPMPHWMVDHDKNLSDLFFTETREVYCVRQDDVVVFVQEPPLVLEAILRRSVGDAYGDVPTLVSFCKTLLQLDPNLRSTAAEALNHAWLT